ncbi:MAG: universal stress protein [Bacillota bacterium]
MFKRLVIAFDGSKHSIRAANYAIEIAKKFNAEIDVIYIVDSSESKKDVLHFDSKLEIEKSRKDKIRIIEEMLVESEVRNNIHILHGEVASTIIDFVNETNYDVLFIGSRGLNQMQSFLLGSVSHKVAKHVKCQVMILK